MHRADLKTLTVHPQGWGIAQGQEWLNYAKEKGCHRFGWQEWYFVVCVKEGSIEALHKDTQSQFWLCSLVSSILPVVRTFVRDAALENKPHLCFWWPLLCLFFFWFNCQCVYQHRLLASSGTHMETWKALLTSLGPMTLSIYIAFWTSLFFGCSFWLWGSCCHRPCGQTNIEPDLIKLAQPHWSHDRIPTTYIFMSEFFKVTFLSPDLRSLRPGKTPKKLTLKKLVNTVYSLYICFQLPPFKNCY